MSIRSVLVVVLALCVRPVEARQAPAPPRPHLIQIVVDDLGWQDLSVPLHEVETPFNRTYHTPAVARLAEQGLVFTNAYAASPVCTPTRTSLMTGQNPARTHITNWTLRNDRDAQETGPAQYPLRSPVWDHQGLQPGDVTLPALLQQAGYRTIHVGKAHFGAIGTPGADPSTLGFDVNIAGHAAGAPGSYYGRHRFSAVPRGGGAVWDVPGLEAYHGQDVYLTDVLTHELLPVLTEAAAEGTPFFLNMAYYGVHTPIMADSARIGPYAHLDPKEAAYASMIAAYDANIGRLLDALDALGVAEQTLIVFTSDNGGLSAHARGRTPMGTGANTHNLPLRSGKGSAYEGGIRVPLLVSWARPEAAAPAQQAFPIVAARHDVPVLSDDLFPTLLAAAGVAVPEGHLLDGHSLAPLLAAQPGFPQERLLGWHYPHKWGPEGPGLDPFTAIREGPWKLIYFYHSQQWELYHLARDLGETVNLVWKEADVARRLAGRMQAWMADLGAQVPHHRPSDDPVAAPAWGTPPE